MQDMTNVTSQGISFELVYSNTIPQILSDILLQNHDTAYRKGLSAAAILMSYALVESKMWSAIVRLTNSDQSLTQSKTDFLSDINNWKFENRKNFLLNEYQLDITKLKNYDSLEHLSNLRNFIAHGGNINLERANTSDYFKFSKDSLRKALLFFNKKNQNNFNKKNLRNENKVEEIIKSFLSHEFASFYYQKVIILIDDFEENICNKIPECVSINLLIKSI